MIHINIAQHAGSATPRPETTQDYKHIEFDYWWRQCAEHVELPLGTRPADINTAGQGLCVLQQRLRGLDIPRRCLLLTMACLANPHSAHWLQHEHGLHYGHLAACKLDGGAFTLLVKLLDSFPAAPTEA